jgi:hypothetical protein
MSSQWPAGPLREFSRLRKLKVPIVTLLVVARRIAPACRGGAHRVNTSRTRLGLTEDLASQCMYEWNEEFVLEELAALLSVWRSATPDLQVVEVWLSRIYGRWKDAEVAQLRMMCEEAGVLCIVHWRLEPSYSPSPMTFQQWVRQGPLQPRQLQLPSTQLTLERPLVPQRIPDNAVW